MTTIPKGMTEQQVLDVIENVARRLAKKYKFGYHTIDDMKQEARLEAWKALDKYDNKRPLENFLWTHVRNRLFNLKRDKYERPDKPCFHCPLKAYIKPDGCSAFENKIDCHLYESWIKRNAAKKNIMQPIEMSNVQDEHEQRMKVYDKTDTEIVRREIFSVIDKYIPNSLRADYIKVRYGIFIPKARKEKVLEEIRRILEESNIDGEEAWEA